MNLFPLTLGVRSTSGAKAASASEKKSMREKTLKRDEHTCCFCGFRAHKFQSTIPWPDAENPPYATACVFCEQVLNLERAGVTGAGLLIWLPEIKQAELNHLARAIYVARADEEAEDTAALATRALDALTLRRADAKKRMGTDDPLLLATIMRESLDAKELDKAKAKLDGIRLLPPEKYIVRGVKGDANQFPVLVKYWAIGPFEAWPVGTWKDSLQKVQATVGNA